MHWLERPGTSLEAMDRITIRASKELRQVPGVRNFGAHVGRAEVADEVVGIDFTELWISLDPDVDYEATVARAQEVVNGYPGLYRDLLTYLRERIKEVLTGSSGAVVVRIFGPDLDVLTAKAAEVAAALRKIDGVNNLKVQQQHLVPRVEVRFKPEVGASLGVTPGDIRQVTETMLNGTTVGQIYKDQKIHNIVVRGSPRFSRTIDALQEVSIDLPSGGNARLVDVADVYVAPTPNQITREAASRRIDVSLDASGRPLGDVATDVEKVLAGISFESGYYPRVMGEYQEVRRATNRLGLAVLVSLVAIFLVLQAYFRSFRLAGMIFVALPAALIGGVLFAFANGGVLSLGSLVGFITVLGISARNGIMMVSHYRHLEQEEGMSFGPDLILRGAAERLSPILMTTLTTGLALFPIVFGGLRPGHEIEHPMAIVILGGLLTSCLLNLFIVPWLYQKTRAQ
jgi:Cu/Ag efflux pump CusA